MAEQGAGGGSGDAAGGLGITITANTASFASGAGVVRQGLADMVAGFGSIPGVALASGASVVGFSAVASLALRVTQGAVEQLTFAFRQLSGAIGAVPRDVHITVGGGGGHNSRSGAMQDNLPPKAGGGPVSSGVPYLVGERGPEIFNPGSSGSIVPNHELGGLGGTTITIGSVHLHGVQDAQGLLAALQDEAGRHNIQLGSVPGND